MLIHSKGDLYVMQRKNSLRDAVLGTSPGDSAGGCTGATRVRRWKPPAWQLAVRQWAAVYQGNSTRRVLQDSACAKEVFSILEEIPYTREPALPNLFVVVQLS
jgi:hypothetical protein